MKLEIREGSLKVKQLDIFHQADGGSIPTSSLHSTPNIRRVGHDLMKQFVETWHYSKRIPTGKNIGYGLWIGWDLYAVIVYGIGVNPYQAKFLGCEKVMEIKRMCRSEPAMDYPLSRFISITSKWLIKDYPFDMIVAFADPEHGHEGTVYKASGFEYHGETNAEWHLIDQNGDSRHRRFAFRYARRNNISIAEARHQLGVKRVKTAPKHRWCRRVGKQLKGTK
tara:strand:+ start:218 stop:886 length:669 start_codon:yes stop_codon:yes gene_type:complete